MRKKLRSRCSRGGQISQFAYIDELQSCMQFVACFHTNGHGAPLPLSRAVSTNGHGANTRPTGPSLKHATDRCLRCSLSCSRRCSRCCPYPRRATRARCGVARDGPSLSWMGREGRARWLWGGAGSERVCHSWPCGVLDARCCVDAQCAAVARGKLRAASAKCEASTGANDESAGD